MRAELFYNPFALLQRLGEWSVTRRRLARLRGTVAAGLGDGHIDLLELLELLRPLDPSIIYDIGANVGTWTLLAKAIFPNAAVHAFEPLPSHASSFQHGVANISNITLHPVALGAENGLAHLHVTSFSDASSMLPLSEPGRIQWSLSEIDHVPVTVKRMDDVVAAEQLTLPDLLKLDVQGFELEVLRGAPDCLAHAKAVIIEVSFREFYRGQCRFDEVVSFLAAGSLFVRAFGTRTALGQGLVSTDVLFVRHRDQ
jgi:FkbM family methyltransferase